MAFAELRKDQGFTGQQFSLAEVHDFVCFSEMRACSQFESFPAPIPDLSQLHVLVGGVPATVLYAGITYAGEFQINIQLPTLPDGNQTITAEIGGISTQDGFHIPIQN